MRVAITSTAMNWACASCGNGGVDWEGRLLLKTVLRRANKTKPTAVEKKEGQNERGGVAKRCSKSLLTDHSKKTPLAVKTDRYSSEATFEKGW